MEQNPLRRLEQKLADIEYRGLLTENYVAMISGSLLYITGRLNDENYDAILDNFMKNIEDLRNMKGSEREEAQWEKVSQALAS